MTRPDKRAAHFGDRYRPPLDWRRLRKAMPAIKRITEALRLAAERIRAGELHVVPSQTQPGRLALVETPDILDRIDSTLAYMTDAQTGRSDEPWPYESF